MLKTVTIEMLKPRVEVGEWVREWVRELYYNRDFGECSGLRWVKICF